MMLLTVLSYITCLFWIVILIDSAIGMRKLPKLENIKENKQLLNNGPLLSVIVAARNEAGAIEESLRSQFRQTYQNIEWIVVNDRSTDETGAIIDRLSSEEPRMTPLHITSLDKGWLGKNHALYHGYQASKGDYLLFTDGDVMYEKDTIEKSITYTVENQIDHLTLSPNMNVERFWTKAFITFFLFGFSYFKRPWKANDDKNKAAIGIGAFNLVTREMYELIGTHEKIRERPDDDLMLGVQIKKSGGKQRLVTALSHLQVEWYPSLKEALIGLEKNTFAGLYYRYSMVLFAIGGVFLSQVWPFIALFVTDGLTRFLYSICIVLLFLVYSQTVNLMSDNALRYFFVFPITALLFIYSIIRATTLTAKRGGIVWRGTFYSLKELRN
ncbi:glycosyltransferase [Bacillus sp. FJAT-45350]|uniref:glycosyltransferase n=1 Tax=Bacillus sp. FJAT-45350 TaxID=2011014 RepID=UPI00211C1BFC|nr:glycosyltransferase family 2 protein [Bacillus sp. FJAT-45350]